jgi:hypothetical protein
MNVITSVTTTSAEVREYLTAARTYYVRTDGNDSNDGLTDTAAGAFLTIQHAVDVVCTTIDINSQTVTIQVADGAYNAPVRLKAYVGVNTVTLQGNTSTPTNVTIATTGSHAIQAIDGNWWIKGFSLSTTGATSDALAVDGAVRVRFTSMDFGTCGRYQVVAGSGATVSVSGAYTISGGAFAHLVSASNCRIVMTNATVTVSGTPTFTVFALATWVNAMEFYGTTFSGAATGKRYEVTLNSVIGTNGGGPNFFPGSVAGTAATGGQYL